MEIDIEHIREILFQHGYEYKRTIGKGGFASVFLCYSQKYDIDFAVKRAVKNKMTIDEYNTLVSLIHPNIIRLYDSFEEESAQYLVMEYCPIGSINQKGKLTYDQFAYYSKQILEALSYCHSLKIAHRDIKPENIFLDQNNNIKLADFGIAKHFSCYNKSDEKCGSLKYFSPEMFQSGEICPFKADIWALGVTFFCMATGDYPFKVANRREDLQKDILSCNFNFDKYQIDERIRFLIIKMTQQNPDMRLTSERLLKLPMYNSIGLISRTKSTKNRRLSSVMAPTQPKRRISYCDASILKNRERAKSMNLNLAFLGFSDDEEQKSPSPLNGFNSSRDTSPHSPLLSVPCTFSKFVQVE